MIRRGDKIKVVSKEALREKIPEDEWDNEFEVLASRREGTRLFIRTGGCGWLSYKEVIKVNTKLYQLKKELVGNV